MASSREAAVADRCHPGVIDSLSHDQWCNRVLHPELEECDCPVQGVVGQLVARGWLKLAEEETGDA